MGAAHIASNQIELSPYLQNRKVVEFAHSQGIRITSYMTLAYGTVLQDRCCCRLHSAHGHHSAGRPGLGHATWLRGDSLLTRRSHLQSNYRRCNCA